MIFRKNETNPDDFWREYEEKTGEKIFARSLGQYISGWEEFDRTGWTAIWGLIISTSGGFRFHHFPQQNWFELFARSSETPKEKTIFLPGEKIISADLIKETTWWKNILKHHPPRLVIRYRNEAENEQQLLFETEPRDTGLVTGLNSWNRASSAETAN